MAKGYDDTDGLGAGFGLETKDDNTSNNDINNSDSKSSLKFASKSKDHVQPSDGLPFLARPSSPESFENLAGLSTYSLAAVRPSARGLRPPEHNVRLPSNSPAPPKTWKGKWEQFWYQYKGIVLMILAQFFGAGMATSARFLETSSEQGEAMSTFQILFVRMSITMITSLLYMWWAKVPHAPFGAKEVRWLLVARGFGGFFGVFGLYYSLVYLPLAEATVITFLAPMVAAWACAVLVKTPFTRIHQIAGLISIGGVVLIAQPFSLSQTSAQDNGLSSNTSASATEPSSGASIVEAHHIVTPSEHAFAVFVALIGVCGAACAYTTITWIGKRAHPLISVNYFATWCTLVSVIALLAIPGATFRLPSGLREWLLMAFLGISGFIMQFLLTAALSHERDRGSSAGLNMVYTQMLFALAMDKLVWGTSPGVLSIVGSSLILGSAIWVAVHKSEGSKAKKSHGWESSSRNDEERQALVNGMDDDEGDAAIGEEQASLNVDVTGHAVDRMASTSRTVELGPLSPISPGTRAYASHNH